MRNIFCQIYNQSTKDVMVHHDRKTVIVMYRKNSSSSIEYCFGQKGKEYFGDPKWSADNLNRIADQVKDYTFINVLREPTSRIISAINQSVEEISGRYGCCIGADQFDMLDKATDEHLMPQILTVPSTHNDKFLEKQLGGVYRETYWPNNPHVFQDRHIEKMRKEFPDYPENWSGLLDLIDYENTILKEAENPKQVWFCCTKRNNVVVDILEYLEYDILVNHKNIKRKNQSTYKQNEVSFTSKLLDHIEISYDHDYKLYTRVKFENM